jgi:hypothetical protein
MIVYNVTVIVDPSIHAEWLDWMKEVHLPEVLATGRFNNCNMFKINPQNTDEDQTYSIQYQADTMEDFEKYVANEAEGLKKKTAEKYGEKVLAYRTILEHVLTLAP